MRHQRNYRLYSEEREKLPYKFRAAALRFCEKAEITETHSLKKGKQFTEKQITGITATDFIVEITKQMIAHHGIRKCASALLQADRLGAWGETKTRDVKVVAKKIGKTKLYKDSSETCYPLDEELEKLFLDLEKLTRSEYLSKEQQDEKRRIEDRLGVLETLLVQKMQDKDDESLQIAVNKWLDYIQNER